MRDEVHATETESSSSEGSTDSEGTDEEEDGPLPDLSGKEMAPLNQVGCKVGM